MKIDSAGAVARRDCAASSIARDVMEGAIAGALATWLMGKVTEYLYEHEDKQAREREDNARGGKTAYGVAAEKVADLVGISLSNDKRKQAGKQIHWALGMAAAAAYAGIKGGSGNIDPLRGLGFGTVVWAVMDETLTPMLGLTPGPKAFPLETHARGLAGHLVFGASVDAALAILNRAV